MITRIAVMLPALLFAASAWSQAMPWESKGCGIAEATVFDKAGDLVIMHGYSRGNAESPEFGKSAYECRNVTHASKEGVEFTSRCTFADNDGNKILLMSVGSPNGWQVKFLGGTGKWEGLSGTGSGKGEPGHGRLTPAVASGCYRATGTYSIRK